MYTLIISSLYPDTVNDHQMLNEEVQIDSQTVKDLFDDTLELLVPAGSLTKGQLLSLKADLYRLITPLKINQETAVNIVLNTHGTPGKHDIDISFIFELVQQLSAEHIRINTIYALMCDGFTKRKATDGPTRYKTSLTFLESSPIKPSSMANLCVKLNHLETKITQAFPIKGFTRPYIPNKQKKMIIDLLLDKEVGETVYAHTQKQKKEDYNMLLSSIALCRSNISPQDPAYITASNALGKLLHTIKQHIFEYIAGRSDLYEGCINLFDAILKNTSVNPKLITQTQFEHLYRRWVKENKLTSCVRLNILEDYCNYQTQLSNRDKFLERDGIGFFTGKVDLRDEPGFGTEVDFDTKADHMKINL